MKKILEFQDELEFLMNKKSRKTKIELRTSKSARSEKRNKTKVQRNK